MNAPPPPQGAAAAVDREGCYAVRAAPQSWGNVALLRETLFVREGD